MNICSLIVHTKPMANGEVARQLETFKGVEVHGGDEMGRLIITVEDEDETQSLVSETINALHAVEGVISTILIYHYGGEETLEEMNREID